MKWMAAVLLLVAVGCAHEQPAYESKYTGPAEAGFTAESVGAALRGGQPYAIAVFGDSTSRQEGAWIYLVAQRIADTYRREVTLHDWDRESNSYANDLVYGSGAPVTVWNGSAPGRSAQYSLQWLKQMAPKPVDLTIINHTHNNPWHAVAGVEQLVKEAKRNTRPGGGVVVMLQNPRADDPARDLLEQGVTDELRAKYSPPDSGVLVVDAHTAFRNAGDLTPLLLPDGAHPSQQGAQLWADTAWAALKL